MRSAMKDVKEQKIPYRIYVEGKLVKSGVYRPAKQLAVCVNPDKEVIKMAHPKKPKQNAHQIRVNALGRVYFNGRLGTQDVGKTRNELRDADAKREIRCFVLQ